LAFKKVSSHSYPAGCVEGVVTYLQTNGGTPPAQVKWASTGFTYWVHWEDLRQPAVLPVSCATEIAKHFESIGYFSPDVLRPPTRTPSSAFAGVLGCKGKAALAKRGVKYWADSTNPEGGTFHNDDDSLVSDEVVLAEERLCKAQAEAEDQGFSAADLHRKGVSVDWLLGLTFALNLWEWKTWEVCAADAPLCFRRQPASANILFSHNSSTPLPPLPLHAGRQAPRQARNRGPQPAPLRRPPLRRALHRARHGLHVPLLGYLRVFCSYACTFRL
jgi:hypothetical protein